MLANQALDTPHPFARIQEEYLTGNDGQSVNLDLELSREYYEAVIAPFIEETLGAIHIALESASLTASQVDEILLAGGATLTPMIRRRLIEVFGKDPRGEVDPNLCVAMGAAIQGAAMAGTEVSAVLVDVTPYTFGTSALGDLNDELYPYCYIPIIPRNTPIPVRRSEVFFTVSDSQTEVDVRIFQGESEDALPVFGKSEGVPVTEADGGGAIGFPDAGGVGGSGTLTGFGEGE